MSLEKRPERIILLPTLEVKDLRLVYNEFLSSIRKREGELSYETHGLYAELPGNNKEAQGYKSAIVFFRGYGNEQGRTIDQESEIRNQHLEDFVKFLEEKNIPFREREEIFRTH